MQHDNNMSYLSTHPVKLHGDLVEVDGVHVLEDAGLDGVAGGVEKILGDLEPLAVHPLFASGRFSCFSPSNILTSMHPITDGHTRLHTVCAEKR